MFSLTAQQVSAALAILKTQALTSNKGVHFTEVASLLNGKVDFDASALDELYRFLATIQAERKFHPGDIRTRPIGTDLGE